MKNKILQAEKLCKSYVHNKEQNHILSQVDLDIYEGDFTVIMGTSGSGKSTLLYALSGMDTITGGKVIYKGKNIETFKEKELAKLRYKEFGFIFQQMHLISNLTLFENIAVAGYLGKENKEKNVNNHVEELLEKMELSKVKTYLPAQVSGGQQQRCAIARAVINNPKILFADEPTGALNRKNTKEVLNLLSDLNEKGQSIVMVTHDIKAAIRANRILYLEDGKIIGELELKKYEETDEKSREVMVNAWLESMEW